VVEGKRRKERKHTSTSTSLPLELLITLRRTASARCTTVGSRGAKERRCAASVGFDCWRRRSAGRRKGGKRQCTEEGRGCSRCFDDGVEDGEVDGEEVDDEVDELEETESLRLKRGMSTEVFEVNDEGRCVECG
jgi:hypothetical protein